MSLAGALKYTSSSLQSSVTVPISAGSDTFTWVGSTKLSSALSLGAVNVKGDVLVGQLYVSVTSMPSGIPAGLLEFGLAPIVPGSSPARAALVQGNSATDGNTVGLDPTLTTDPFGNTISSSNPLDLVGGVTLWGTDFYLSFACAQPASSTSITFSADIVSFTTLCPTMASNTPPFAAPSPHIFPASLQG